MQTIFMIDVLKSRQAKWALAAGAVIYALLGTLGSQMDIYGHLSSIATAIGLLIRLPIAFMVLILLFFCISRLPVRKTRKNGIRFPAASALLLFFSWLPMFLIEYPGSFMYDTQRQVFQIAAKEYDAFHPLLHTLLLRACLSLYPHLQSIERCAALYSLVQMAAMAICFSIVCRCIQHIAGDLAAWLCLLFYAIYPSHMAMACNYVKDALFSACFSVFLALFLEERFSPISLKKQILLLLFGILSCLLRNNMLPATIVWALFLLLSRNTRRAGFFVFLMVGISLFANEGLIRATNAKRGSIGELLSVPIQQLSRARISEEASFTEEEKIAMDTFFPNDCWQLYEPTLSDPVKAKLDTHEVNLHPQRFVLLWLSVGRKCTKTYIEAFLHLALPSLYPYRKYKVAQPYLETGLQPGVVSAPFGQPPMVQPARFSAIRTWLNQVIYDTGADSIPILSLLMNTGAVFWMLFFCMLSVISFSRTQALSAFLLPLLLYGTYLLGPVMQGRYLYPFLCVTPLFICASLGLFPKNSACEGGSK